MCNCKILKLEFYISDVSPLQNNEELPPAMSILHPLFTPLYPSTIKGTRGVLINFLYSPFNILVVACIGCYWNCVTCGFVFDDLSAIKESKTHFDLHLLDITI